MRCHPFTRRFECDRRQPECGTKEGGKAASEAVPHQPDVSMGKEKPQVVDKFLDSRRSNACREKWLDGTYHAGGVK